MWFVNVFTWTTKGNRWLIFFLLSFDVVEGVIGGMELETKHYANYSKILSLLF